MKQRKFRSLHSHFISKYPKLFLCLLVSVLVLFSCSEKRAIKEQEKYGEPHRPQLHFSPDSMWMNDPNGMVYLDGEYHLFYQYYPDSTVWGPMHWGHAISCDLIHWEHLPIALYPDSLGWIFSGSAVADLQNTSGLGTANNPPLVAIFTYHNNTNGIIFPQSQGIAYSLDKGRTWSKYAGNPVLITNELPDFRDPKVVWHETSHKWIMALAVKDHVAFYSSFNLIDWNHESNFGFEVGEHRGIWECPELLKMEDEGGKEKWVLFVSINSSGPNKGSGTQYFVGDFDGFNFTSSQKQIKWIDFGSDNYAGVTWSNVPKEDGRTLFLGWMSNWMYATVVPTDNWRNAMTFPRELTLTEDNFLRSLPVRELELLRGLEYKTGPFQLDGEFSLADKVPFELYPVELNLEYETNSDAILEIILSNSRKEKVVIAFNAVDNTMIIDRSKSGSVAFSDVFYTTHVAPIKQGTRVGDIRLKSNTQVQMLIDVSSIEVFVNEGETVMTDIFFPSEPFKQITFQAVNGNIKIEKASVYKLNSIWN
ncbi:MAG: glycoside hydrolase family 32 protein [Prolixibacteraceae bacterium]